MVFFACRSGIILCYHSLILTCSSFGVAGRVSSVFREGSLRCFGKGVFRASRRVSSMLRYVFDASGRLSSVLRLTQVLREG